MKTPALVALVALAIIGSGLATEPTKRVDFRRWEPRHAQILVFSFVGR